MFYFPNSHIYSSANSSPAMAYTLVLMLLSLLSFSGTGVNAETETQLHFYFHDIVAGPNRSAIRVAEAPSSNSSATSFGVVVMIDNPLTESPDVNSKLVGRAQGTYSFASQEEVGALLMAMNLVFLEGDLNGSSVTVFGRNLVTSDVREMPIIGGTGKFRLARGYVLAHTNYFDLVTGNTIVEYNATVLHNNGAAVVDSSTSSGTTSTAATTDASSGVAKELQKLLLISCLFLSFYNLL